MTSANEIASKPGVIFDQIALPYNLREHLIRVAAVADTICKHWSGPALERHTIVAACLLHDIGNIMKMDFDSPLQKSYMVHDVADIPKYKLLQQRLRVHYGKSPEIVRTGLMKQTGVEPVLIQFIERSRGVEMPRMLTTTDFAGMIYLYADNRVIPQGVCTLSERIADAKLRYPGYYEAPEHAAIRYEERLHEMETVLQAYCALPLSKITEASISNHRLWSALR